MSVKIMIDSASDMTKQEAEASDLAFLPLKTAFGDTVYYDGVDLTHEQFYELLASSKQLPVTSQITPYQYAKAYEDAFAKNEEILVIAMSSKLSGTYQSAVMAAKETGKKIAIVDSENATVGEQILIKYAIRLRDEGMHACRRNRCQAGKRKEKDRSVSDCRYFGISGQGRSAVQSGWSSWDHAEDQAYPGTGERRYRNAWQSTWDEAELLASESADCGERRH